jgi:hypothetical protein
MSLSLLLPCYFLSTRKRHHASALPSLALIDVRNMHVRMGKSMHVALLFRTIVNGSLYGKYRSLLLKTSRIDRRSFVVPTEPTGCLGFMR